MMRYIAVLIITTLLGLAKPAAAQQIAAKIIDRIESKAAQINTQLDRQTEKYLRRLEKQEAKLKRKLFRKDSSAAAALFKTGGHQYQALAEQVTTRLPGATQKIKEYLPGLDSATTALKFIKQNSGLLNTGSDRVKAALTQYETLQQKLTAIHQVQVQIKQRKAQLSQVLSKYNLGRQLKKYNKAAYYYGAQVNEYKQALKDPAKMEKMMLAALNKIPAFNRFFQQFSAIGQLFPQAAGTGTGTAALAGLQTRVQVMRQLQNLGAAAGPGNGSNAGLGMLQQNLSQAQQQLAQLKNKILQAGGGSSDFEMPDFKPNEQKTKSFLQRFELKTDLQSTRGSSLLPNMLDMAVGLNYKLSGNKNIGVQAAYKLGLGNRLNHIQLSSEGLGLRSFADFKIGKKNNFWLTGGYERNYFMQPRLSNYTGTGLWNEVAAAGLSKKYRLGKKRQGEMKILYNFLWRGQPGSQPFIYRTGINF
jgi:hypothetical protein